MTTNTKPVSIILAIVLLSIVSLPAQHGVRFMTGSFEGVRSIAQEKNMNLLIDTYASWCIPCKRMDKVFAQKEVGQFFNDNYITYRVNMDGPYGDDIKAEFQVVFLPTIIIVGPDGTIKYKVDREMSASELLSVGKLAMQEGIQIASDATPFRRNGEAAPRKNSGKAPKPAKRQTVKDSQKSKKDEKIVYVMGLDGLDSPNAEYLKKEAYFRLELMDGSHVPAAQKYLETQSDWNSLANMRFILDFVSFPNSPMYNHVVQHKQSYYDSFSKEQVDNTLQILVYKHLFNGIPRPTMQQATQLYTDLGYQTPELHAEKYFIVRYKSDKLYNEAYEMSYHYLSKTNPADNVAMGKFFDYLLANPKRYAPSKLLTAADLLNDSNVTAEQKITLELQVIKLLVLAGECDLAKKRAEQVKQTAKNSNTELPELASISINCGA